jgi:hypothetical protein
MKITNLYINLETCWTRSPPPHVVSDVDFVDHNMRSVASAFQEIQLCVRIVNTIEMFSLYTFHFLLLRPGKYFT